jgi:hypothetical protein
VTIRAKLYVAILLSVLGPVVTIAVALHGMQRLGDRFDEVQERADHRALALDLKFDVTDFNGWQTAYGYDNGASRPRFERSVRQFRADFNAARNELTDTRERRILRDIGSRFDDFMRLDAEAYSALQEGRGASATETAFDDTREDSRRGLIAVALGAALVIILLLVTASDIARMALEGRRE